ncbi:MAG: DUF4056 domain-containing protein [Planctomycetota bacterium]|jgi:hypothetical protein
MNLKSLPFNALIASGIMIVFLTTGCSLSGGPRGRWGWTPDVQPGNPDKLGTHSYSFGGSEGFGIFYTLRGGSIDLDHVRGCADMTKYTYVRARSTIEKSSQSFSTSPAFEWTTNKVKIGYPENWDSLPQTEKDDIAHQAALIIAPVVAYNGGIWHEMITWKGTHFMLIEPEHTSAFSWDDLYSNLMGAELAMQAIQDGHIENADYNRAMTRLIKEEFKRLQVVPRAKAIEITKSVKGSWYGGGKLTKRNMDTGYDDGWVTPSLIPGYTDEEPIARKMPTIEGLDELGIKINYTISSAYFENGELKKIAGTKSSVRPLSHYPKIMKNIEQEAIYKYGYQIR